MIPRRRGASTVGAIAAALCIAGGLAAAPPVGAAAGDAIEFGFVAKTENQIQFGICTNIDDTGFTGGVDLQLSVTDAEGTVIKDTWDWSMIPGTTWIGLPSKCREFDAAMQWVWPAWNSVSGLSPGTTYTFNATMTLTPVGGAPAVYTASQQATTGGGCPVGAPDDSLLRKSAWNGIGVDADGRAVLTGMQIDPESVPDWVSAMYPQVVQWVPEYLWSGKTLAAEGYFWDPVTQNFGPPLPVGETETSATLLALAGLDACNTSEFTTTVSVDPSASEVCASSGDQLVGVEPGACPVTLTVTAGSGLAPSLATRSRAALAPPRLSAKALVVVRPGSGGGGGSGGGSGGGGGGGSGAAGGGSGGGGSIWLITEVRPASGPVTGGTTVLALGWGMADAQYAVVGGVRVPVTVINDGTVQLVTPPGSVGWQELRVFLPNGSVPAAFEYVAAGADAAPAPTQSIDTTTPAPPSRVVVRPARIRSKAPEVRAAVGTVVGLTLRGVPTRTAGSLEARTPGGSWARVGTRIAGGSVQYSLPVSTAGVQWLRYTPRGSAPRYVRIIGTESVN